MFYRPVLPLLPLVMETSMVIVCFRWDKQLSLWNILTFCRVILPPPVILMEAPQWARMFLHVPMSILRPLQDNPFIQPCLQSSSNVPDPSHKWYQCCSTSGSALASCPAHTREVPALQPYQKSWAVIYVALSSAELAIIFMLSILWGCPIPLPCWRWLYQPCLPHFLPSVLTWNSERQGPYCCCLGTALSFNPNDYGFQSSCSDSHCPSPPIVSPGTPSLPTQMAANPNHLIISAEDPSSLLPKVPPGVLSPGLPSPVMVVNPNHLTVSPVCPPSHNPPVPSIAVSPVVSLGGLSSPSSDTRMEVDHDLHVSQLRSGIHSSTTSTDIRMDAGSEFQVPQSRAGNYPGSTAPSVVPENLPAPAPSSFPTSPPVTPRPTRPIWPLVLPRVLEDITSQVVSERLDVMVASLVKPTVRGIMDTCIPHLTDLIDSHFATESLTPSQSRCVTTCKSRASRQPKDSGEGTDGDDEMEEDVFLKTSPRQKKPGPWGKMNRLHVSQQSAPWVYLLD